MNSSRRRPILGPLLTSVLVVHVVGAAVGHASGQAGAAQSLRIAGAGSVSGTVLLSREVDLTGSKTPVFTASHPARLDAIVLIRQTAGNAAPGVAAVHLQSGPLLQRSYVFLGTDTGDQVEGTPVFATRKLPAGRYRLMMLSRGANDVTLTLPSGRSGVTRVAPTSVPRYTWQETSGSVAGVAATPSIAATTTFEARSSVLQVGLGWLRTTSAATRFHACSEASPDTMGTLLHVTPVCRLMAGVNNVAPGVDRVDVYQAFHQPDAGTWDFRTVALVAGAATAGGALSLQVELGSGFR